MKKTIKKIGHLLVFILILNFFSCEKEEITEEKNAVKTKNELGVVKLNETEAKNYLDQLNLPFNSVNNKLASTGNQKNIGQGVVLFENVTQIIAANGLQNVTFKVIHPSTTSFRFYNLVISSTGQYTTAKIKEYIMNPSFHNRFFANLATMNDFEGVVLTRTIYSNHPCPEEDVNMVVSNSNYFGGGVGGLDGVPTSFDGINYSNFFAGNYTGTSFSNSGYSGSGGTGENANVASFDSQFGTFLNNVGSSIGSFFSNVGTTLNSVWRWIRSFFCGSCSSRASNASMQQSNDLILVLDPPSQTTTTFNNFPCPELNTDIGVLLASPIDGNNYATASASTQLWWDTQATPTEKNAISQYLRVKGHTQKNLSFVDNIVTLQQTNQINIETSIRYTLSLNNNQYYYFTNQSSMAPHNFSAVNQIIKFVSQNTINNTIDNDDLEFANQFIDNLVQSGLKLDFEKSLKSPANIDLTAIDISTPEGQHFTWIYEKLMASPKFKEMFTDTFKENVKLNVKFEIAENLGVNGNCRLSPTSQGGINITIKISKSLFGVYSNMNIAKTILHECIHAYLGVKKLNSNLGTTITELNNLNLTELLGTYSVGFGGIVIEGHNVDSHNFMFNYMIPVFKSILGDLKSGLVAQDSINYLEQQSWNLSDGTTYNFNWQDAYYFLSLLGLQNSSAFQTEFPDGSINKEKFDFLTSFLIANLTKIQF